MDSAQRVPEEMTEKLSPDELIRLSERVEEWGKLEYLEGPWPQNKSLNVDGYQGCVDSIIITLSHTTENKFPTLGGPGITITKTSTYEVIVRRGEFVLGNAQDLENGLVRDLYERVEARYHESLEGEKTSSRQSDLVDRARDLLA